MILAIDVGGTKTLVALFDEDGVIQSKDRFETPKQYSEFIGLLRENITKDITKQEISACAIAMPGRIDRTNGHVIAFGNLPWANLPIVADLRSVLPNTPILLENDANLAGLSEALLIPQFKRVLYLTVSTGIGGGFVVKGELEPAMLDFEPGQALIEYNDEYDKWEHFASGSAIVRTYGQRAADITDEEIWKKVAHAIVIGLYELTANLQPEVIIFGGGVGSHLEHFQHYIETELSQHPNPLITMPVILKAQRAEDAVLYGGYSFAVQQLAKSK